jgi:hypothetical protein
MLPPTLKSTRPFARSDQPRATLLFVVPNSRNSSAVFRGLMYAFAIESVMVLTAYGSFLAWRGMLHR